MGICCVQVSQCVFASGQSDDKPQTLLFSATVPHWVQRTARRYLRSDIVKLDLVGEGTVRTATSVEVHTSAVDSCCIYSCGMVVCLVTSVCLLSV